jgi:hypothetical protein
MRVTSNIARILLRLLFRFGHSAPFETAIAREYMGVMLATPYGQRTLPSRTSPSVQKWHDTGNNARISVYMNAVIFIHAGLIETIQG